MIRSLAVSGTGRPGNDNCPERPAHQSDHAGTGTPKEATASRITNRTTGGEYKRASEMET